MRRRHRRQIVEWFPIAIIVVLLAGALLAVMSGGR